MRSLTTKNSSRDLIYSEVCCLLYVAYRNGCGSLQGHTPKRMYLLCTRCGFTTKVSTGVSRSTWIDYRVHDVNHRGVSLRLHAL